MVALTFGMMNKPMQRLKLQEEEKIFRGYILMEINMN